MPLLPRFIRDSRFPLVGAGILCAGLIGTLWAGCSVEKDYETLSFFFDGVPNPEARARAQAASGVTPDMRSSPTYSVHKPFAEEQCAECHAGKLIITGRESQLCLKCHEEETKKFPKMHGPVAAVACRWCHLPHESAQPHLLRAGAVKVCTQCHEREMLANERLPAHADDTKSCLDCHVGHGGNAAMFLREGVSRLAPLPPDSATQGP